MEQKINDGGPAFPVTTIQPDGKGGMMPDYTISGMSLRDYFAAKAMQASISGFLAQRGRVIEGDATVIARASYNMADAMLRVRAEADARRSQQEPQTDGVAGAPKSQR